MKESTVKAAKSPDLSPRCVSGTWPGWDGAVGTDTSALVTSWMEFPLVFCFVAQWKNLFGVCLHNDTPLIWTETPHTLAQGTVLFSFFLFVHYYYYFATYCSFISWPLNSFTLSAARVMWLLSRLMGFTGITKQLLYVKNTTPNISLHGFVELIPEKHRITVIFVKQ